MCVSMICKALHNCCSQWAWHLQRRFVRQFSVPASQRSCGLCPGLATTLLVSLAEQGQQQQQQVALAQSLLPATATSTTQRGSLVWPV